MDSARLESVITRLEQDFPGHVARDVDLAAVTAWRVGGRAAAILTVDDVAGLAGALQLLIASGVPHLVIGGTSNLLFDDAGVRGVLIRLGPGFSGLAVHDGELIAGASLWVPTFVRSAALLGFGGIEHAIGIPGTLGGLVAMNGGSLRQSIGDHIGHVAALDRTGQLHRLERDACRFSRRASIFSSGDYLITSVGFRLAPRSYRESRPEMLSILKSRRLKFPRKFPNCGSVFVSTDATYALLGPPGALIEACGLKGSALGGAVVSPLHANFIVNTGGAGSQDILGLIRRCHDAVRAKFDVNLRAEVKYVTPDCVLMDPLGHARAEH